MFQLRRMMVVLCLLCSVCACVSNNQQLVEGIKCFKSEQYRNAFIKLKPLADKGVADAQYAVGYMYYYGEGVYENRKKALYWIRCAAKQGQPDAVKALKILTQQ